MAVENKYTDSLTAAGKVSNLAGVKEIVAIPFTFEVAAADSDGSVYRVIKGLNYNLIPVSVKVLNDAITSGTDYDLGLYETELGAEIDKDVFADGLDMSSSRTFNTAVEALITVDPANITKTIMEHAGDTLSTLAKGYDLAFTANTVGSAAGTISGVAYFVQA